MQSELQKRLTERMKIKGLTIAKLEQLAGVKRNIARNILKGQSQKPSAENLQSLAQVLECSMTDLMGPKTSGPVLVSDLPVFDQTVKCVLTLYQERQETPSLDQLLKVLREVYLYAIRADPKKAEPKFADWIIEQSSSQ